MLDTMETLPEYVISRRVTNSRFFTIRKADLCFAKLRIFAYTLPYISHLIDETKKLFPEAAKQENYWREEKSSLISTSFYEGFLKYLQLKKGAISIPYVQLKELLDELIYEDFKDDFNFKVSENFPF